MKQLVCFGTGNDGKAFLATARGMVRIEYFLDNYYQGYWEGYEVFKPLKKNCKGKYIVVTTTEYYMYIKKQLEDYGLCEKIDFVSVAEFLIQHPELLGEKLVKCETEHLYLREKKVITYQLYCTSSFLEKDHLGYETNQKAVILPIRKYWEDGAKPFFGRGGVTEQSGEL